MSGRSGERGIVRKDKIPRCIGCEGGGGETWPARRTSVGVVKANRVIARGGLVLKGAPQKELGVYVLRFYVHVLDRILSSLFLPCNCIEFCIR